MIIEQIYMDSFMGKKDYGLDLAAGVNVIEGDNECGKSTVASFIKFMLYGASSKAAEGASLSERRRFLGFNESGFGGNMTVRTESGHYRIDRKINSVSNGFRESLSVTDLDSKKQVFKGEEAGEALLGLPETVFTRTAYISQANGAYSGGEELGSAVENLLFSGDETVSAGKAVKKLDSVRVSLRHKNGKGGFIYESQNQREALCARLQKALSDNSEIIAKEGSLNDTNRRIEENKLEYERCGKVCDLYDNYIAYTRFKKLDAAEEKLKSLAKSEGEIENRYGGFVPDGEYLGRLRKSIDDAAECRESVTLAERRAEKARADRIEAENGGNAEVTPELSEGVAVAEKMQKGAGLLTVLGIAVMLLGVGCIALGLTALASLFTVLIAVGAVAAIGGIILLAAGLSKKRKAAAICKKFGAATVAELLEKMKNGLNSQRLAAEQLARLRESESNAEALLIGERDRLAQKEQLVSAEASKLMMNDAADAAIKAEELVAELSDIKSELEVTKDRISHLFDETRAFDREAVESVMRSAGDISVFEKLDIEEYKRRRKFSENAVAALTAKKSELEKSLAALGASAENPALIFAGISELDKQLETANRRCAAADLAMASLEKASIGLRTRVSPRLAEYSGKVLGVLTDGRYTDVGVDSSLELSYMGEGGAHSTEYMSGGTRDGAYFALRLALHDLVCKTEKAPLILDECFAHTDDSRTEKMLRILAALASDGVQSIVLTCHLREGDIAEKICACQRITLKK